MKGSTIFWLTIGISAYLWWTIETWTGSHTFCDENSIICGWIMLWSIINGMVAALFIIYDLSELFSYELQGTFRSYIKDYCITPFNNWLDKILK